MALTLYQKINAQYDQAIDELRSIINAPPCTPQQRYDFKKAVRAGRMPRKATAKIERQIHELEVERKAVLGGVQQVVNLLMDVHFGVPVKDILEGIGYEDKED